MTAVEQSGRSNLPEAFLAEVRRIVGQLNLKEGDAVGNLDYGVTADNLGALAVALPSSTEEVADLVKCANRHRVSVVPHGGRTGLVGGGVSSPEEIVISTARLNRTLEIFPTERVAIVAAGVTLQTLQEAARQHGLEPGIDLASRGSATIGGMVSTNAGGVAAFRYGVMRHRVLGIEAVMPDGSTYSDLTRVIKNAAGYDLKHLFIGAEGTLGIVTRAVIKLEPVPLATATAMFALPGLGAVLDATDLGIRIQRGNLRAAEAMWRSFFQLTSVEQGWTASDYDNSSPLHLLMSLAGANEPDLLEAFEGIYETLAVKYPDVSAVVATSQSQEEELWRLREDTDLIYRKHPAAPSYDVSVPLSEIEGYVTRIASGLEKIDANLAPYIFGHIADGNLHIVLNAAAADCARETVEAVESVLYRGLHRLGGSFSAEHGVGRKRIGALSDLTDPVKLSLMKVIKAELDSLRILNPNKVIQ
ncbi:FAD-binding oxidoreductase [Rhizobium grahamii]|uniref:FAD linked oxidase-like protein n=1 Tax=Rhizobium grahamii CCGE 502 TaxID=990285 RepID=S3HS88_9HYPH|nr:FAD-binding oxidoreductase [Rhizobium grahamii]EPE96101.1 FAD linked oxidase-like protein [Rhizobium grahamii CCGE 502]